MIEISQSKSIGESDSILFKAFDKISECIIISNLNKEIFYANEPLCKLLGLSSDKLIGTHVNLLFENKLTELNFNPTQIDQEIKKSEQIFTYCRKDKTHILLKVQHSFVKNNNNSPIAEMFIVEDISEQDKLIGEIRRKEFTYKNLFEKMSDAFASIKVITDSAGKPVDLILLDANHSFEKLVKISLDNLIGQSILQFLERVKGNHLDPLLILSNIVLKQKEEQFELEVTDTGQWFSVSVYSKEKAHAFIIMHDISKRKRFQGELNDSKKMLRTIIDNIPQRVFWKDVNSTFMGCNIHFAKDVGLSNTADIKGKTEYDLFDAALASKYVESDKQIIEKENFILSQETEQQINVKPGKLNVRLNKLPLKNNNGEIIGVIGTYEDISQQKKITENLSKLSQAVEQSPSSIVITDINGNIEYVNPKYCSITGYVYEELIGKNQRILKSGNKSLEEYKNLWDTISLGNEWTGEFLNKKKNGELFWERAKISPIKNNEGVITHYLGIKEDITESKAAEKALQDSYSLLEATLNSTIDGILVTDIDGKIQKFNKRFLEMWNIPEEIINTRNDEIAVNFVTAQLINPERFFASIKEFYKNKLGESTDYIEFKDGRIFERFSRPQFLNSEAIGRVWSFRDITARKRTEDALIESERRFRSLFETSIEGILATDENDNIILVNPRMTEITGYTTSELLKMKFTEMLLEEDREDHSSKIKLRIQKISGVYDRRLLTKEGKIIWTKVSASPLLDKERQFRGSYGMVTDITENKIAAEELKIAKERAEEINRIKSIFLANISHELRTPLIGILGYAETLYNEIEDSAHKEMAKILLKSGNRLKDTLNLILDLSHIEAEKINLELKSVNLSQIALEKVKQYQLKAFELGLKFQIIFGEEDIEIIADANMLSQVLEYLLSNAVKYTPTGSITVLISKIFVENKYWAEVKIRDTGIGIPKERIGLIFEPFRQVSEGLSRSFEGIGLGLTIAKNFVEKMGGKIKVESQYGEGSEFTVAFPLAIQKRIDITEKKISINSPKFQEEANKYKYSGEALLIEDDQPTADIVRIYLSETCKTDWASDGKKAIQMASQKQYSIVLVDINLGLGMDGIETVNRIKKLYGYRSVPFVAVTAYALFGDKEKFLKKGCTHYISKPFDRHDIVELVDKILSTKK